MIPCSRKKFSNFCTLSKAIYFIFGSTPRTQGNVPVKSWLVLFSLQGGLATRCLLVRRAIFKKQNNNTSYGQKVCTSNLPTTKFRKHLQTVRMKNFEGDSLEMRKDLRRIRFSWNTLTSFIAGSQTTRASKMADLREPFELCRVLQNSSLIGISRHLSEDHVLLTFSDRGVLAYNVSYIQEIVGVKTKCSKLYTQNGILLTL